MQRVAVVLLCSVSLAACGGGNKAQTAAAQGAPNLPPFNAADALSLQSANACYLDAAEIGAAMGGSFDKGTPLDVGDTLHTCLYGANSGQVRVTVRYIEPANVDAFRAQPLPGEVAYIPGDADHAAFQKQSDGSTCAITFMRANLQYDLRLMNCKDAPDARERLLKLTRP